MVYQFKDAIVGPIDVDVTAIVGRGLPLLKYGVVAKRLDEPIKPADIRPPYRNKRRHQKGCCHYNFASFLISRYH